VRTLKVWKSGHQDSIESESTNGKREAEKQHEWLAKHTCAVWPVGFVVSSFLFFLFFFFFVFFFFS